MEKFFRTNKVPLLTLSSLVALSACQSRLDLDRAYKDNLYSQFLHKQNDPQLVKRLSSSSYNLMRATYPVFLADIQNNTSALPSLQQSPQGLVHGDFHPLQMALRKEGEADLDDWDSVAQAPLWQDIVRMESSALLLARSEGLRSYPKNSCLKSYTHQWFKQSAPSTAKAISAKDDDIEVYTDFSKHPAWTKASSTSLIDPILMQGIESWFDANKNLPIQFTYPQKRLSSGVGSLLKEKIIFLDPQNQLWELKEVTGDAPQHEGCKRYESFANSMKKLKRNNPIHACMDWQERTFVLLKWDASYWSPSHKDFDTTEDLSQHVEWMCSEVAKLHKSSLEMTQIQEWNLILKDNKVFEDHIQHLSERVMQNQWDAFHHWKSLKEQTHTEQFHRTYLRWEPDFN